MGAYDERLIVTTALDPCLHAYPVREWEQLEAALAKRNPMEPGVKTSCGSTWPARRSARWTSSAGCLIPPSLRAHAGLDKDVVWAGMVKVIELWSRGGLAQGPGGGPRGELSADVMRVLAELRQEAELKAARRRYQGCPSPPCCSKGHCSGGELDLDAIRAIRDRSYGSWIWGASLVVLDLSDVSTSTTGGCHGVSLAARLTARGGTSDLPGCRRV